MMRRLLITDHYDSPAFELAATSSRDGDAWEVFLLGGSSEWFQWRHLQRLEQLGEARFVDPADFQTVAHELVAEFVVSTSETLPKLTLDGVRLLDLLAGNDGNGWWYLETSEKGAYRGPLIGQLYRLALAQLAIDRAECAEVWFSVRERALARAIASAIPSRPGWRLVAAAAEPADRRLESWPYIRLLLQSARAFSRFLSARVFCATLNTRQGARGVNGRWIFTVFPSWWTRTSTAAPADRFFTNVADATIDGYLAWLAEPAALWRHARATRQAMRRLHIIPLQRFLSFFDGLTVFSPRRFWRLWRFERTLRPSMRFAFAGFPVESLLADDIRRSLSGNEPLQNDLLARATARATAALSPELVLYRAEFQPIESAVAHGIRNRALTVGYQHHPFGRNYLQMRFTRQQIEESTETPRGEDARPLPDAFVAIGPALAKHVVDGGFPALRVGVCGPQRYGPLVAYRAVQQPKSVLRTRLGISQTDFVVFVALAIVESDTEALFGALVKACRGLGPHVRLIVRTHPNRPQGDPALHATLEALGRSRAELMPAKGRMYDYISAADCMVCVGSMIAFEAIALGVMPIVVDNPSFFGAISLAEYEDGLFVVRNAAELRVALDDMQVSSDRMRARRARWTSLLGQVMGDLEQPLGQQLDAALDSVMQPFINPDSSVAPE